MSATHVANEYGTDIWVVCGKDEEHVRKMTQRGIIGDYSGLTKIGRNAYERFGTSRSSDPVYFSLFNGYGLVRDTNQVEDDRSILYDGAVYLTVYGDIYAREKPI